jgi:hypothetical protein
MVVVLVLGKAADPMARPKIRAIAATPTIGRRVEDLPADKLLARP